MKQDDVCQRNRWRRASSMFKKVVHRISIARCLFVFSVLVITGSTIGWRFLPIKLKSSDLKHIWIQWNDIQNFPVEETDSKDQQYDFPVSLNTSSLKTTNYIASWRTGFASFKGSSRERRLMFEKNSDFLPELSLEERKWMVFLLKTFIHICEKHNFLYFLIDGSLLGVYRHHGITPWDEDLDVMMNGSEHKRVYEVFSNIPGFGLLPSPQKHWKFFLKYVYPRPQDKYNWPFLDIFFFTEDATHIWTRSRLLTPDFLHKKEDIFPLQFRPFEGSKLPVPCNTKKVLTNSFDDLETCVLWIGHRQMRPPPMVDKKSIKCENLYWMYPFVFRQVTENKKGTIEILKVGSKVLSNVTFPNVCV